MAYGKTMVPSNSPGCVQHFSEGFSALLENNLDDDDATEINSDDLEKIAEVDWIPGSPKSISLLLPCKSLSPKNKLTEKSNGADGTESSKSTQTDLIFPHEESNHATLSMQSLHIMSGLLAVKRYATENMNTKRKTLSTFFEDPRCNNTAAPAFKQSKLHERMRNLNQCFTQTSSAYTSLDVPIITLTDENSSTSEIHEANVIQGNTDLPSISSEALRYSLRQHLSEDRKNSTFRQLFDHVAMECIENAAYVADNWSGSLIEMATKTLLATADIEGAISGELLGRLADKIISEISREKLINQAHLQESRVHIVLKFCECNTVCVAAMNAILLRLTLFREALLKDVDHLDNCPLSIENVPYILHITIIILQILERKFITQANFPEPTPTAINILNLWKRHWHSNEPNSNEVKVAGKSSFLQVWSHELELVFSVFSDHAQLFAPSAMTSVLLVKELMKKNIVDYTTVST